MISYFLPAFAGTPIPRDLPLPLPIPEEALRLLIVPTFLLHILFVNLVVGASLMTVIFEGVGRTRPRYDRLAFLIAETITVNKSLAVVLGIAPLLMMNLLYTSSFYAANALTGHAWALLVPLITVAFLLSYLHKYTWERWAGRRKPVHLLAGGASALLFLAIPLIFLTNINLMLFPENWSQVSGFFSSLRVGNVFPRYFHFLGSSLAVTGLFLVARFGWSGFDVASCLPEFEKSELLRHFYRWTLYVTLAQFVFGPLLLLTLPTAGLTPGTLLSIGAGVIVAALVLRLMSQEIQARQIRLGWRYAVIVTGFGCTVFAMGYGRHLYREGSLAKFKTQVEARSREFAAVELATHMSIAAGQGAGDALTGPPNGKQIYAQVCGSCHKKGGGSDAPALTEIYSLYKDNPAGIVTWANQPGKKRPQFPQMPAMAHLGEDQLTAVAKYMLELGGPPPAAAKPVPVKGPAK